MINYGHGAAGGSAEFARERSAPVEETYPVIGFLCLLGIFMHLFLSNPVLSMIGIHYADEDNAFWEKQHPGTYVILLSFLMLLWRHGRPIDMLVRLYRSEKVFTSFFVLYILTLTYMISRSGAKGLSFLIDTQVITIIAALVLSRTPASYCRNALYIFIAFAVANSVIGIGEGIYKERIFTFDPTASILFEKSFRASALLGHPLNNALFTPVMIFIALGARMSPFIKLIVISILAASLVAFGGRTGLIVACLGLGAVGGIGVLRSWRGRSVSLLQILLLMTVALVIPLIAGFGLYSLLNSGIGERIFNESDFTDESAEARVLALRVFDFMKPEEIIFGMAPARTTEIANEMHQVNGLLLIENPWLLMFMHLGLVAFPGWFIATLALMWRLMHRNTFAIKLAVGSFFIIASGSNSFGVKGSEYLLMVSAVICATRARMAEDDQVRSVK